MNLSAQDAMRAHYDSHANQHQSAREAEEARRSGGAFQLKKFHNDIKRALIQRYAHNTDALLDLACGRGGDLRKWTDAKIKYVKGIDLSPGEIAEAQRRFTDLRSQGQRSVLQAEFEVSSQLGVSEWRDPDGRLYDSVTCMFALHYFFASEAALKQMLHNVCINLKPGGYFFGTIPDGKRVLATLNRQPAIESPMLNLAAETFCDRSDCAKGGGKLCVAHELPPPAVFGSAYTCAIGDTVTAGKGDSQGSSEYLVFANVLQGVAHSYGLHPVTAIDNGRHSALSRFFDPADDKKLFKHFDPKFDGCDKSLSDASALFCAFVFQKHPLPNAPSPTGPSPSQSVPQSDKSAAVKRKREQQDGVSLDTSPTAPEAGVTKQPLRKKREGPQPQRCKVKRKAGADITLSSRTEEST